MASDRRRAPLFELEEMNDPAGSLGREVGYPYFFARLQVGVTVEPSVYIPGACWKGPGSWSVLTVCFIGMVRVHPFLSSSRRRISMPTFPEAVFLWVIEGFPEVFGWLCGLQWICQNN